MHGISCFMRPVSVVMHGMICPEQNYHVDRSTTLSVCSTTGKTVHLVTPNAGDIAGV